MKNIVFLLLFIVNSNSIYLNNTKEINIIDNAAVWTESQIWGPLIEEWTFGYKSNREQRVMKLSPVDNTYVISNRKDPDPPGKVLNSVISSGGSSSISAIKPSEPQQQRQITETDLYLLGAIEKLVYRTDFMEKRLRRVEEMLYYVMAGSRIDNEPCPDNFSRAGSQCYYFSDHAGREKDWKASNKLCQKMGAVLAEMETIEENQDVVAFIQTQNHLKGKDFWTGGLNPGLLWIWSNSARPVSVNKNQPTNTTVQIPGNGRCLRLSYDPAYRNYAYRGSDCSSRFQYICEIPDRNSSNQLRRLARNLDIEF